MKFPSYTNKKRTKEYLSELERVFNKLEPLAKKAIKEDCGGFYCDTPIIKKGDLILITDVEAFSPGYSPISSMENDQQATEHAESNAYFFKLVNKPFLVIGRGRKVIDKKGHLEHVDKLDISVDIVETSPLEYKIVCEEENYVFLPHPKEIPKFKKFLPFFSEKPEKLEKILDRYYSKLGLPNS